MSTALLVAESEPSTRGFLERHLSDDGFAVVGAGAGGEALELAESTKPDLVLLDCSLPDASGLDLCRRLREGEPGRSWDRDVPVILLGGAESDPVDRVRAFARGCDDYVARPFHYEELLARIHAVLRRVSPPPRERLETRELLVDLRTRRAAVRGQPVSLAGKEFALLVKLATEPTRVWTKEQLGRRRGGLRRQRVGGGLPAYRELETRRGRRGRPLRGVLACLRPRGAS